jgi:hypothetical protein
VRIFQLETGELLRELHLDKAPEQCHFSDDDHTLVIKLDSGECIIWILNNESEIKLQLDKMNIEDLTEEEKFHLGIIEKSQVKKVPSDPLTPFSEDLPLQLNLENIRISYA